MSKLFIASFLFILCSCARIHVSNLEKTSVLPKGGGMIYKLPQTQLVFEVTVKTTDYAKGDCFDEVKSNFKGEYDKDFDSVFKKQTEFSKRKIDGIALTTMPIDDPSKFFVVSGNKKLLQDRVYGLTLADAGFLSNGEFQITDNTLDVAVQTVSSLASFASTFVLPRGDGDKAKLKSACESSLDKLKDIRTKRFEFASVRNQQTGVQLPSVDLYNRVLTELDKQETTIFSQLMFETEITYNKIYILLTPEAIKQNKADQGKYRDQPFFLYNSATNTLKINKDLVAKVDVVNNTKVGVAFVAPAEMKDSSAAYFLDLSPVKSANKAIASQLNTTADKTEGGIFYNIPQQVYVSVAKNDKSPLFAERVALPQWGYLGVLEAKLSKLTVALNPQTGALTSVSGESKGVTTEQVKAGFASAESVRNLFVRDKGAEELAKIEKRIKYIEAKQKLDQLEEGEPEELIALRRDKELLTERKNVLELKKAIKELEKEEGSIL